MNLNPIYTDPYSPQALKQQWSELCLAIPELRIREATAALNVSEAELLATGCGSTVTRLNLDWPIILQTLPALGTVMALTHNDFAVHETTGMYIIAKQIDGEYRVKSKTINLQLTTRLIGMMFGVTEPSATGPRHSLQFFGADGSATHKIYMTAGSDLVRYHGLLKQLASPNQSQRQKVEPQPRFNRFNAVTIHSQPETAALFPTDTETGAFNKALIKMGLLPELRPVSSLISESLPTAVLEKLMRKLALLDLNIGVCVKNSGCVQVYQGMIQNIRSAGPWFDILDEHFGLHLNTKVLSGARFVTESDGLNTRKSLEVIDTDNRIIALVLPDMNQRSDNLSLWDKLIAEAAQ